MPQAVLVKHIPANWPNLFIYPEHPLFQGLSHVLPTAYNPLSLLPL